MRIDSGFSPSPLTSFGGPSLLNGPSALNQSPQLLDLPGLDQDLFGENRVDATSRDLNLDPACTASNPEAAAQVNSAQGDTARQITGEPHAEGEKAGEKKEEDTRGTVGENIHRGVGLAKDVVKTPGALIKAGEKLAGKYAIEGVAAAEGTKEGAKVVNKTAASVGEHLISAGEKGEKLISKIPGAEKVAEGIKHVSGVLTGDAASMVETADEGVKKAHAFVGGFKGGGGVKGGLSAMKEEGKEATKEGVKETAKEGAKEGTKVAAKEGAKEAASVGTKELAKEGVKAAEKVAVKEGAKEGGKLAAKEIGKFIPGLNVAVSLGCAGMDVKDAAEKWKSGNKTGAVIEGLHSLTDAAGVVPGVGTAISLAGDALSIGAHWLTGK